MTTISIFQLDCYANIANMIVMLKERDRGEWGYLDRFLFFLRRPFPNYPICEKCFIVFFSLFSISGIFYFILESLVHPLPIFKVSKKKWAWKNLGFIWDRGMYHMKHSKFSTLE